MTDLVTTTTAVIHQNQVLNDLVAQFLLELQLSPASYDTYRKALKRFVAWVNETAPSRMDHQTLVQYRSYLLTESLSAQTVSTYITAVKSFFSWTGASGIYPDVASKIKGQKKPKGFLKDALSIEQVKQLLA